MTRARLLFVWVFLLALLLTRFIFYLTGSPSLKPGKVVSFTTTIQSEPTATGNIQRFEVSQDRQRILVWTERFPQYHYGDTLRISGKLEANLSKKKNLVLSNFRPDIRLYFPKIKPEKEQQSFLAVVEKVRQHILLTIRRFLPSNAAALLAGILLGAKEGFSEEFYGALRTTGTLHVVAASGMNVSILASFLIAILLRFFKRRIAALFVVIAIFFYASLALFQPAIVRASIMGIALFTGSMLNRQTQAALFLALACYTMLLFDPFLILDIGFQLSFAATAGLLFLMPLFEKTFHWFFFLKQLPLLGDGATTTIVAQLATLPILLANFGSISPLSILVNALILWTSQPVMFLGIIAALLSFLPILSYPILLLSLPFLVFFEKTVLLFGSSRFLFTIQFPFLVGFGYYCLLVGFYFFLTQRKASN